MRVRFRTLSEVRSDPAPTLATLAAARARQRTLVRVLRPLAVGVLAVVALVGPDTSPRPGLSGDRLGVLVALVCFAVGIAGVLRRRSKGGLHQLPFFVLLLGSAVALIGLQLHGPGFVGVFVAVGAAALRVRGWLAISVFVLALAALAAVGAFAQHQSWTSILLAQIGLAAFYTIAQLASRLREGQEQAERLLIEIDRNREAQAQAAVFAERQRLAREMHDVLAHSLSGLVLQLEGARMLAARSDAPREELSAAVERAHRLARAGLEEARRAIGMLRDDELPGPERLPTLARQFEHDTGVPCETRVRGAERDLPSDARLTVYRVAQEALTNIRRHAAAARVEMQLAYDGTGASLTVEDFGDRRAEPIVAGGGYGLAGMRERADLIGGRLDAAPTETGFRVELWVPA
jgi:signal transduction histidine kinase